MVQCYTGSSQRPRNGYEQGTSMSGEADLQELLELLDKQKVLLESKDTLANRAVEVADCLC